MRTAEISRKTSETDIFVKINLDGNGTSKIDTGVGFFDHMLTALSKHSGIDIEIKAVGDLYVDCHHTVEDVGITLGLALSQALSDKSQIARYGSSYIPMDEALGFSAVDISGRPFLVFDCNFTNEKIGVFDTCMCVEFMRALSFNAGLTLHAKCLYGENDHHKCEAIFKAVAHALKMAVAQTNTTVLSTKGSLA